ncbi:MAG: PcfB family protein [Oscillospiraceae bacterium]
MYNSGDAAEQIVRMSLEGAEVALKITGAAAKNIAAALYTVLKDQKKTKGKARIETMLRQQRPMTIYTVKKEDCPEFARQAKSYGILYAPIPIKRATIPSIFWYSRTMQDAQTGLLRNSSWLRKTPPPSRVRSKNPENRAAASRPRPSSLPRKRARKISWWTKCWKNPRKRKGPAGKSGGGESGFFFQSGGKIPSVRAYLREQQQARRGYF